MQTRTALGCLLLVCTLKAATAETSPTAPKTSQEPDDKNDNEPPLVQTRFGELRGFISEPFPGTDFHRADVFLGVPYAEPPLDELRFEKPQPYNSTWTSVRNATEQGAACFPLIKQRHETYDEDCLVLNIIRPHYARERDRLPVIFYVYESAFAIGSIKMYGSQNFSQNFAERDCIVVLIQYRLGLLGFFNVGDPSVDTNLGLFDITMALRWTYENIGAFGGDNERITALGLSGGGTAIGLLTLSPYSRDFLSGAIEMSGGSWSAWAVSDETIEHTLEFARHVGCPTRTPAAIKRCFKSMDPTDIVGNTTELARPPFKMLQYTPGFDGDFFPRPLNELLAESARIPFIRGITDAETIGFVAHPDLPEMNNIGISPEKMASFAREDLVAYIEKLVDYLSPRLGNNTHIARQKFLDLYETPQRAESEAQFYYKSYLDVTSDFLFNMPAIFFALERAHVHGVTHFYLNSYFNRQQYGDETPIKMSSNDNELPYITGVFEIGTFEMNEADRRFQELLLGTIEKFAKDREPGWPAVTTTKSQYGRFTPDAQLKINGDIPFAERVAVWQEVYALAACGLEPQKSSLDACNREQFD